MLRVSRSRLGFFNMGCTIACFKEEGKIQVAKEQLIIDKMQGLTVSNMSFKSLEGITSNWEEDLI